MSSIKENLEEEVKVIGKNHLNSKISELLELGNELCSKNAQTLYDAINIISERVAIYQEVLAERYP